MQGVLRCLSLRTGLLSLLATLVLIHTLSPILAEPTRGGTLKFVTANDLKVLDPFWTTAYISRNHGYMIYDVLFALDDKLTVQPQMVNT
jgi:ABC-type transport system substrate-binding protein